jgi:lipopolysaccharide transport system ATP-binding protein
MTSPIQGVEVAVRAEGLAKKFRLFDSPRDRLKEALHPFGKAYHQDFWALKDVGFEIPKGQSLGILGRNGSGKSTLLRILASVLSPTEGKVEVNGRVAALLELGAGFHPDFTGRENAILQSTVLGYSRTEINRRLPEIESFANIGEFFDRPVKMYSSGMFLRVAFSTAINVDPDIIIIDEALAVGDARFTVACIERLLELQKRGVTLLLVSHYPDLIVRLCERAILLDQGRLIFLGAAREAGERYYDVMFREGIPAAAATLHQRQERPKPAGLSADDGCLDERFKAFTADTDDMDKCVTRRSYNVDERRVDSGRAVILDYNILGTDELDPVSIRHGVVLDIFVKVKLLDDVEAPLIGYAIWSANNVQISGSNSHINPEGFELVERAPYLFCRFRVYNRLSAGSYFVDIGVTDLDDGRYALLQTRQRLIHVIVEPTPWFTGLCDIGAAL